MPTKRVRTVVLVCGLLALASGVGLARAGLAQDDKPGGEVVTLPYAAALTDASGHPVADGLYSLRFELYADETGGQPVWTDVQSGVAVRGGQLETAVGAVEAVPATLLQDGTRWLSVAVQGPGDATFTALVPRQRLEPELPLAFDAPQSAQACPHDHAGEQWAANFGWANAVLKIINWGNGPSIWGWNGGGGNGLRGYSGGQGVGVYGESPEGVGVAGRSAEGRGVEGYAAKPGKVGVFGKNEAEGGGGYGVFGWAPNGTGVKGHGAAWGLYSKGDMRVEGYSLFDGGKSGYVVEVARNASEKALETGDLVVITGAGPAVLGDIPVIGVSRATDQQAGAVVGIVDKHFAVVPKGSTDEERARSAISDSAIGPGSYLTIVTLGAYKAVKVDATRGPIAPGDRLVASPKPGYAMRALAPEPGTIIGKALGALQSGTGVIPVMVTLQ
jgi:hypothetical protein